MWSFTKSDTAGGIKVQILHLSEGLPLFRVLGMLHSASGLHYSFSPPAQLLFQLSFSFKKGARNCGASLVTATVSCRTLQTHKHWSSNWSSGPLPLHLCIKWVSHNRCGLNVCVFLLCKIRTVAAEESESPQAALLVSCENDGLEKIGTKRAFWEMW